VLWLVRPVFLGWVGDAARYFGSSPSNPVERQEIRAAGIDILKRLHNQKVNNRARPEAPSEYEYDRIVVVGHSLGSVIAYDMLTHYWAEINQGYQIPATNSELKSARALGEPGAPTAEPGAWATVGLKVPLQNAEQWQAAQTELVNNAAEAQAIAAAAHAAKAVAAGAPETEKSAAREAAQAAQLAAAGRTKSADTWRITDLVTLGSPLTYARFLMASDGEDLANRQRQRELPTCPPTSDEYADKNGLKSFVFFYDRVVHKDHLVPNHSAPFLVTRWTNIYLVADPIGGPIAPLFGWGIRDVRIDFKDPDVPAAATGRRDRRPWHSRFADVLGAAHVRYWEVHENDPRRPLAPACAHVLREIVWKAPIAAISPESGGATTNAADLT
jgi:hypothetical protein